MAYPIKKLSRRKLFRFLRIQQLAVCAFVLDQYSNRRINLFCEDILKYGHMRLAKSTPEEWIDDLKYELNRKDHEPKGKTQIDIVNMSIDKFLRSDSIFEWLPRKFKVKKEEEDPKKTVHTLIQRASAVYERWKAGRARLTNGQTVFTSEVTVVPPPSRLNDGCGGSYNPTPEEYEKDETEAIEDLITTLDN